MAKQRWRSVTHEPRFTKELAECGLTHEQSEQFIEGLEWILARDPGKGRRIKHSSVFALSSRFPESWMPVIVYYTFDVDAVHLLSIVNISEKEDG